MTARHPLAVRALDVSVAVVGLVLSAPLWPIVALAIKLTSPGPVLFRATRMGAGGEAFTILKLRTMRAGSASAGPAVTAAGDARVTPVGRVLRATKVDELPQLLNVLRGDMALVGARPEDPRYRGDFTGELAEVLAHRPGITGAASLEYRHEESLLAACAPGERDSYYRSVVLPAKARIDLEYLRRRTVRRDVGVLVATARAVVRRAPAPAPAGEARA